MAFIADAAFDAKLAYVADSGTRLDVCSAEPTTYTAATSTFTLGTVTLTAGNGAGDYTLAAGDVSGRKLTVAAQVIASASAAGTPTFVAITDGVSELLAVTSGTGPATSVGAEVQVAAFDIESPDATSA